MKYLVVACDSDLDTIISMYLYLYFIAKAGFEGECYLSPRISKKAFDLMHEFNIELKPVKSINKDDRIIILSKDGESIDTPSKNITEIISLKENDFSKYEEANISVYPFTLLTTIIMKRYREYELLPSLEGVLLLNELYNNKKITFTEADKEIKKYVEFLYENRKNIT